MGSVPVARHEKFQNSPEIFNQKRGQLRTVKGGSGVNMMKDLSKRIAAEGIDLDSLISPGEAPVFEKYDEYIPSELLRKAYKYDKLRSDEIIERAEKAIKQ